MTDVSELLDRMERASAALTDLANEAANENRERLRGKADGVALAMSYIREWMSQP